jgi:hypothetical protein
MFVNERAIFQRMKLVGKDVRAISNSVAIEVDQHPNAVILSPVIRSPVRQQLFVIGNPVGNRAGGEVAVDPTFIVTTVIRYSLLLAKRLAKVNAAAVINRKSNRVRHKWLSRPDARLPTLWQSKIRQLLGCLLRCRSHGRLHWQLIFLDRFI